MKWSSGWVLGCVVSLITMVHGVCADASLRVAPGEIDSELQESSTQELQELFDVRDHKGNRILRRKNDLEPGIWATRDPEVDGIEGTSTDRVYKKFRIPRKGTPVIVAVIDGGVDISHPELKDQLWTNTAELNGLPGVDDDHDGYIDDVYGWNFLGNRDGRNLNQTNLEVARYYSLLKKKESEGILASGEREILERVSNDLNRQVASTTKNLIRYEAFAAAIELLKQKGLASETVEAVDALPSDEPSVITAKALARRVFAAGLTLADVEKTIAYFKTRLRFHLNPGFDSSSIVGDDPSNLDEAGYGNPDVTGPDALHGTHVAGIIAANRDNEFGIEGQARNVRIMAIRAVPDGDERDKDVANAIRFAVDHGARIINMSFGKPYSPFKSTVDAAVRYAESKGVLLVHAAGNESKNTEGPNQNFPSRKVTLSDGSFGSVANWIEVGASGPKKDETLAASFSNYGKTSVDVFAPGVGILSTAPGGRYQSLNGTSMASPEVAGVAALLMSKLPSAGFSEIRAAILDTVNLYPDLMCQIPSDANKTSEAQVPFSSLSVSGGTVNAYRAMQRLMSH